MFKKHQVIIFLFVVVDIILILWILLAGKNIELLNPQGLIALKERNLMMIAVSLAAIVVIPVFILTFFIATKYRSSNDVAKYSPEQAHNFIFQAFWWIIPGVIILALAVVMLKNVHALDPHTSIESAAKPVKIRVVALQWKWLFIYPEQNIATVNYIQFPEDTPVSFDLTADAPMNSFWIPQLGGQIYAMTGMSTKLNLIADKPGEYQGSAAEINGKGFSGMKFVAKASSQADFDNWVAAVKEKGNVLTFAEYERLAKPSEKNPVITYSSVEENLYNKIMTKFMAPPKESMEHESMEGHN